MKNLIKELIFEMLLIENKKEDYKPPKHFKKGMTLECEVKKTANKRFINKVKNFHENKKIVKVKLIVPDGPEMFSIVSFNKKNYKVKTSSLK